MTEPGRKYYSERQGRGPAVGGSDFPSLRRLGLSVIAELHEDGYFAEAFGFYCVDQGNVGGTVGRDVGAWFLRTIARDDIWPFVTHGDGWDADTFFDVLEALHDVASRPTERWYHDYADCGWHYTEFDREAGREEYRKKINAVLRRFETPLEMNFNGEIVQMAPEAFRRLLEAPVPDGTDRELITTRVEDAVALFRQRRATREDRRRAVRELADVLEVLRAEIKEEMLTKDESELFHIANNFSIRHNNRNQKRQYDDLIWLTWVFYVYLATVHAVLRVRGRQEAK